MISATKEGSGILWECNIGERGKEKRERETRHKRHLTIENKLGVDGGMWVGDALDG